MPVVSSQYWNTVHGMMPGEAAQDAEGLQTMRTLGKNMAWLIKNIKQGGEPVPKEETWIELYQVKQKNPGSIPPGPFFDCFLTSQEY